MLLTDTEHIHDSTPAIALRDVCVTIDRRPVLTDITFTVNRGDFIAVTGPNGGGKTTMMRVILKLLRPASGTVTYYARDGVTEVKRLPIGYLPQKNMIDSHFPIDVRSVVASGLDGLGGVGRSRRGALTDSMLERVDLAAHASKSIGELSGGQLQRVLLGRALIASPEIMVLDEPLSYLDKRFEARFYDMLRDIAPDTTVILVSHEMTELGAMANRHLIVNRTLTCCPRAGHAVSDPCAAQ